LDATSETRTDLLGASAEFLSNPGETMNAERRMKALVVSHDSGAACAYAVIARSGGWDAMVCGHDQDVVGTIRDGQIDALIFDFSPKIGIEALQRARQGDLWLPVILITAYPVDQGEMMNLGVKVILSKPPDLVRLREALAALSMPRLPVSDIKVLFQFLERCEATQRTRDDRGSGG
jgi:DNA-binding response OmpR family regulator